MSEYQYYEFQSLDRPLTREAQAEMRRLSSRVQLTASSASFVYNYGSFRDNPEAVLAEYFDAMLYITNWGTRQLMFRFPANAVPDEVMRDYQYDNNIEWSHVGAYTILNIEFNEEEGDGEWVDGEGLLSGIAQVRNDILRGDYRALYLAWLMIADYEVEILEEDDDLTEPPVPPNLESLSNTLRNFTDFFEISSDLIDAAAQASPHVEKQDEQLSPFIDQLSEAERRSFLERLLKGESLLDIALAKRLRELAGVSSAASPLTQRRGIRQIEAAAKTVQEERRAIERQKAEAIRLKKIETIADRQAQLWAQLPGLIEEKQALAYKQVVNILTDLRDLAAHQQSLPEFQSKVAALIARYPRQHSLHRRLRDAKII